MMLFSLVASWTVHRCGNCDTSLPSRDALCLVHPVPVVDCCCHKPGGHDRVWDRQVVVQLVKLVMRFVDASFSD